MKKILFLILSIVLMTQANNVQAQKITVEQANGSVSFFQDLNKAILAASDGASIYLSAGNYMLNDSVKISKRINLFGVGYNSKTEGGISFIHGNIHLNTGSDESVIMGVYVQGNINIGNDGSVHNILIKYCKIAGSIGGNSSYKHTGININQCNVRRIHGGGSPFIITNCIISNYIYAVNGGKISHNTLLYNSNTYNIDNCFNSIIEDNICFRGISGTSELIKNNFGRDGVTFVDAANEDYRLTDDSQGKNAALDGTDVGAYGGSGFNPMGSSPAPRVVLKSIPSETDADGNLKIRIKVIKP